MQTDWYSDETATFGDRILAAREALQMSDEDLARRLGVKLTTLRAWENDRIEPRANRVSMLSGILSVSLRWLLTGEGHGVDAPHEPDPAGSDLSELLTEMRRVRSELMRNGERLGRLEKRLQSALREMAA